METKIKETKTAILDRIMRAVSDENKNISIENLETLTKIVNSFDSLEIEKKMGEKDYKADMEQIFGYVASILEKTNNTQKVEDKDDPKEEEGV